MLMRSWRLGGIAAAVVLFAMTVVSAQRGGGQAAEAPTPLATPVVKADARIMKLKEAVSADVLSMYDLGQQMVDTVFSFGELGFQEFETQKYLTGILQAQGFTVQRGVAGVPTA